MSQQVELATISLEAAAAVGQYIRVKLDSNGKAAIAGLNEPAIGITQAAAAIGLQVPVRLLSDTGTFKMTANAAITQFATVFGTANGKIDDTTQPGLAGGCVGIALEAATAGGDVIEVLPIPSGVGLRLVMGQHTSVAAVDTVVTGLAAVYGAIASYETDPADANTFVSAAIGDQAGAPAAGSIYIKTWKTADGADVTPAAATAFSKKVNWIAWGK